MFFERDFLVKQERINEQLRQRELERQLAVASRSPRMLHLRQSGQIVRRLLAVRPFTFGTKPAESC